MRNVRYIFSFPDDHDALAPEQLLSYYDQYRDRFTSDEYQRFSDRALALDNYDLLKCVLKHQGGRELAELGQQRLAALFSYSRDFASVLIHHGVLDLEVIVANSELRHKYDSFEDLFGPIERELKNRQDAEWESASMDTESPAEALSFAGQVVKYIPLQADNRAVSWYGFPTEAQAHAQELQWQQRVCEKFFRVGRPLKAGAYSSDYYVELSQKINKNLIFKLDRKPIRSVMIALARIIRDHYGMPNLRLQFGETVVKFTHENSSSRKRQQANFMMKVEGLEYPIKYGRGLMTRLNYLVFDSRNDDDSIRLLRENQLRTLMQQKLQQVNPFSVSDLNPRGYIKLPAEPAAARPGFDQKIKLLNGLLLLVTVVEVLNRLYRDPQGKLHHYETLPSADRDKAQRSDAFPVASAQARALMLWVNNLIATNDFLGESKQEEYGNATYRARYGTVTGVGTIDNAPLMRNKLIALNLLWSNVQPHPHERAKFKREFLQDNEQGRIIPGRHAMRDELGMCYGLLDNESGSEESDYSDDEMPQITL